MVAGAFHASVSTARDVQRLVLSLQYPLIGSEHPFRAFLILPLRRVEEGDMLAGLALRQREHPAAPCGSEFLRIPRRQVLFQQNGMVKFADCALGERPPVPGFVKSGELDGLRLYALQVQLRMIDVLRGSR